MITNVEQPSKKLIKDSFKKLHKVSLYKFNAMSQLCIYECSTAEQLILLCGVKLFLEFSENIFLAYEDVNIQIIQRLISLYETLPTEVRYLLELEGCRQYLDLIGHLPDLLTIDGISYALFFLEEFGAFIKNILKRGDPIQEWVFSILLRSKWDQLPPGQRKTYFERAERLYNEERMFQLEMKNPLKNLQIAFKPLIHFKKYGSECKHLRKKQTKGSSDESESEILKLWNESPDTTRMFYKDRVFREQYINMFTERHRRIYELRNRST